MFYNYVYSELDEFPLLIYSTQKVLKIKQDLVEYLRQKTKPAAYSQPLNKQHRNLVLSLGLCCDPGVSARSREVFSPFCSDVLEAGLLLLEPNVYHISTNLLFPNPNLSDQIHFDWNICFPTPLVQQGEICDSSHETPGDMVETKSIKPTKTCYVHTCRAPGFLFLRILLSSLLFFFILPL